MPSIRHRSMRSLFCRYGWHSFWRTAGRCRVTFCGNRSGTALPTLLLYLVGDGGGGQGAGGGPAQLRPTHQLSVIKRGSGGSAGVHGAVTLPRLQLRLPHSPRHLLSSPIATRRPAALVALRFALYFTAPSPPLPATGWDSGALGLTNLPRSVCVVVRGHPHTCARECWPYSAHIGCCWWGVGESQHTIPQNGHHVTLVIVWGHVAVKITFCRNRFMPLPKTSETFSGALFL